MLLLTGATGFVGIELLARYPLRTDRQVHVLCGANARAAAARIERTLAGQFGLRHPYVERVVAGWRVRLAADIDNALTELLSS